MKEFPPDPFQNFHRVFIRALYRRKIKHLPPKVLCALVKVLVQYRLC